MQAIILAAGMGRRLGPYTKDNTKCMLPVNGVRLIDRMLTQLSTLRLNRVILVVGYQAQNLMKHLEGRYPELNLEFHENPIYDRTNNIYSLSLVKQQLQEDDTLLLESDLIFEDSLLSLLLDNPFPNLALVAKYEAWMDGTMVKIDQDNHIVHFVPKKAFRYAEVDEYYKTVNIYKFSRSFAQNKYVPFLDAYSRALGNNEYYEQVLRVITLIDNTDLKALPIGNRKWYEIDDVQDHEIAETIFSPEDQLVAHYERRYGGHWRFPKMLDYCYLVNPYFPTPRMRDELRANFDILLTQYPSGMQVNSLLAAKYFNLRQDYVVVGNGAAEIIKSLMERQPADARVGVVYPTFQEYPNRLRPGQIEAYYAPAPDYSYTADDLMAHFTAHPVQTLMLINPDNPSGHFIPKADVLRLARWAEQQGTRLVVDESFVDFTDDFAQNTLLTDDLLAAHPTLVVVKSISKSYGVPGLRLGIAATADEALMKTLRRDVAIWNINSFAEYYMQIFGKYTAAYHEACVKFIDERRRFTALLQKIPYLRVLPTQANYVLCKVEAPYTSAQLTHLLLARYNILIKDCDNKTGLKGTNHVRLAIRDRQDNDTLLQALTSLA